MKSKIIYFILLSLSIPIFSACTDKTAGPITITATTTTTTNTTTAPTTTTVMPTTTSTGNTVPSTTTIVPTTPGITTTQVTTTTTPAITTPTTTTIPTTHTPTVTSNVLIDFDSHSPTVNTGLTTPFQITTGGLTTSFKSTAPFSSFSIQNPNTTFFVLSEVSGNYLVDNDPAMNGLVMVFSHPVKEIDFTFVTLDYHGTANIDTPTTIKLTVYADEAMTDTIGTIEARGVLITDDTFPQGTLTFDAQARSFVAVKIELVLQANGATHFLIDNINLTPLLQ